MVYGRRVNVVPVRVSIVLSVMLGLFGCERLRDVKRCQKLAQEVNRSLDTIAQLAPDSGLVAPDGGAAAPDSGAATAGAYHQIAREYDTLATGLDGFDAGTPELVKAVGELAGVARTSARQAAALGSALAADNRATVSFTVHELERLARHEKSVVARIDDECRPK
jgi:hypothetical protein